MTQDPKLPNRLQYPAGLQRFTWIVGLAGATAVLVAVATGQVAAGAYFVLAIVLGVLGVNWFFGQAGSRRTRAELADWARRCYDVPLTQSATRTLTSPARDARALVGDWTSEPANVLHQSEAGSWAYIEVRLAKRHGEWFLYSPDYGDELPQVVTEGPEQDLSAALSPLMGEVLEAGGMYYIILTEEDGSSGGLRITVHNGDHDQAVQPLWSDALRAELWLSQVGATRGDGTARIELFSGAELVNVLLPDLIAEGTQIGLNWGADGASIFDASVTRTFLSRYF